MAQLISYTKVNGGIASDHPYNAEVQTQDDIEEHRRKVLLEVNKGNHNYNVYFGVRKDQGSLLMP